MLALVVGASPNYNNYSTTIDVQQSLPSNDITTLTFDSITRIELEHPDYTIFLLMTYQDARFTMTTTASWLEVFKKSFQNGPVQQDIHLRVSTDNHDASFSIPETLIFQESYPTGTIDLTLTLVSYEESDGVRRTIAHAEASGLLRPERTFFATYQLNTNNLSPTNSHKQSP